ncbi:hypothetical protein IC229_15500 [Spirosoma sp. BT702]|uniref:Uncharacterized protein n=1 Tax=Spirosoma profusum TaxID=2771354 RepID=A0A926XXN2_9BACT|nr:hypothetical protein [Spirosoma profusum]MBD2702055.1 hypothetical protein [Spirosoma profusum]
MSDEERAEWLAQRKRLVFYFEETQQQIIDYPAKANDEDYLFLTRKAIYYQDMINKLDDLLNSGDN